MVSVEALQRDVSAGQEPLSARSLQERADFAPVWNEIKKIGNQHFVHHQARDLIHDDNVDATAAAKRAVADDDAPNFTPVWEALRDLVDSGYTQAAEHSAAGASKRDANSGAAPLKLDYKPLMKAGIKFGKQVFKSFTRTHNKRSGGAADYKPFIDAASTFAMTAVKEMFVKSS